jgi:SAM-dependent methyltransferase
VENLKYEIYNCDRCNTNFVFPNEANRKLYDLIYSDKKTPGTYISHWKLAKRIKSLKNPLRFLLNYSHTYYPIINYLKGVNSKDLDILEIGCGYGYLTYALNLQGYRAIGIDISEVAIKFALENFGRYFFKADINEFITNINKDLNKKFDLIIAIEVIEHLSNPVDFIVKCFSILKERGRLILTTPNKSYYPKNSIWRTDLPPVHLYWFSCNSFEYIAKAYNLNISFTNFKNYISFYEEENKLVNYILSRIKKESVPDPIFKEGDEPNPVVFARKSIIKRFLKFLINIKPIKYLSNLFYIMFFRKIDHYFTLGIILWKK